jgi:hypothetical protein
MLDVYDLSTARGTAKYYLSLVEQMADEFCDTHKDYEEPWVRDLLEDVSYSIMRIAVENELRESK